LINLYILNLILTMPTRQSLSQNIDDYFGKIPFGSLGDRLQKPY